MLPVEPLSVLHLSSWSNTTSTAKQTSIYPVGQPALLGHSSVLKDLDTQWICWKKHLGIIQWLEGPNEAFIGCLGNIMNRAHAGQVRYDWINIIFHRIARPFFLINKAHLADQIGCLPLSLYVLVSQFWTLVLPYGVRIKLSDDVLNSDHITERQGVNTASIIHHTVLNAAGSTQTLCVCSVWLPVIIICLEVLW